MKIEQQMQIQKLGLQRPATTVTPGGAQEIWATQLAREVERRAATGGLSALGWRQNWLKSTRFRLVDLPLSLVAVRRTTSGSLATALVRDMAAASALRLPVIVDVNKNQICQTPNGFVPKVIVVDGSDICELARMKGQETVRAWVGDLAAAALNIYADDQVGAQELSQKINAELVKRFKKDYKKASSACSAPGSSAWVVEVYPFENYFVYNRDGDLFKQTFKLDSRREVAFVGEPMEVRQSYVDLKASAAKVTTPLETAMAIDAGAVSRMTQQPPKDSPGAGVGPRITARRGRGKGEPTQMQCDALTVKKVVTDYETAVKAGYKSPTLQATAPPGMEDMVQALKAKYSDDESMAFKVAWHQYGERKKGK